MSKNRPGSSWGGFFLGAHSLLLVPPAAHKGHGQQLRRRHLHHLGAGGVGHDDQDVRVKIHQVLPAEGAGRDGLFRVGHHGDGREVRVSHGHGLHHGGALGADAGEGGVELHVAAGDDLSAFRQQGRAHVEAAEGAGIVPGLRRHGDELLLQFPIHGAPHSPGK